MKKSTKVTKSIFSISLSTNVENSKVNIVLDYALVKNDRKL